MMCLQHEKETNMAPVLLTPSHHPELGKHKNLRTGGKTIKATKLFADWMSRLVLLGSLLFVGALVFGLV